MTITPLNVQAVVGATDERQQTSPDTGDIDLGVGRVIVAVRVEHARVRSPDLLRAVNVVDG